jgi:two-component system cell cycle sensor histidine kinase/response regulator CckA
MNQLFRILYVDDYPLDRELVRDALEREQGGFELVEAASRADFETALAQGGFDLVLSDFNILGFEGLQVLEMVHAQDASLPVIIVTGTGSEEVAAEAIKRGATDYVIKTPRHIQHLSHTIYTVLEKKRLEIERQQAEAALRESERKYRTIIERFAEGFALIDEQGYVVEWNQAMEEIFGVKHNEAIGRLIWDIQYSLLRPEHQTAQVYESLKATLSALLTGVSNLSGKPTETVIQTPHGESKIIQQTAFAIELKAKRYIANVVQDITKRKQGEDALRESEEIYRTIVDTTAEWIWEMDLAGNLVFSNPQVTTILGYHPDEFIGQKAVSLMHEDDRREVESALPYLVAEEQGWRGLVLRWRHKDGTYRYLESNASPKFNAAGELVGYIGAGRDITERKLAEQERERLTAQVRKQAQQMEQILATVPAGVLLLDAEWRVMQANPVAETHLAVLAEVEIGDRLSHLGDHPLGELLTPPPTKGLWHEVKANGQTFEVISRPMETGAEPEHWVLVINDVTREREVQTQLQRQERLAAVGQLASGIAHDFNNIMAVILLYTQMLLKMPDSTPKSRERLEIVSEQTGRATTLIQQILDFSRRAVLERCPMDLALFLKEIVKLLERTIPESIKIKLAYEIGEYTVNADPTRLQQAVMNLVINARDAMPEGGELNITLSRSVVTDNVRCVICGQFIEGEWVCIRVTDTGTGISPDVLPYIFDPFFTTKEIGHGTGLGLAQVYGIVAQHEGHIEVATQVGRGTTFAIYLPALLEQPPETPILETQALVYGHGETILVVEDDVSLRDALADSFELLNYRVLQAANGREALEILEQHAGGIALVLSDMVMPEMGGQALFYALQQRGITLPVAILSGHSLENELESLKTQGLAGWIPKPPDIEQLSHLVERVLLEASEQNLVK